MIDELEPVGLYDARQAALAGRRCGIMATVWWHLRRGVLPSELDQNCQAAYRAYHRTNKTFTNRARQRALAAVKELYPWQFEQIRRRHRWDVELELANNDEEVTLSIAANRARQRALVELSHKHWADYARLREEVLNDLLEEVFGGHGPFVGVRAGR